MNCLLDGDILGKMAESGIYCIVAPIGLLLPNKGLKHPPFSRDLEEVEGQLFSSDA